MRFALKFYCLLALLTATAPAQTLLYQWNLNNATGSGTTLTAAPSAIDPSMTGGILTNLNGGAGLSAPAGSGVNGANNSADFGLINSTAYRSTAGAFAGGVGNLSGVSSFTVSLWFNLNATVTSFSSLNGGVLLSRLFDITTTNTSAADGDELYFALNTGTNLQFGVNKASTGSTTSMNQFVALGSLPTPATMTNVWIFVAASYTTASGGTVTFYTGTATSNAVPVSTLTGVGAIAWSATTNFIFIGNRGDGTRSLPGTIDNVNFYSGTQTLAQIIEVQTNVFVANNSPAAGVPVVSPSSTIFIGSSVTITSAVTGALPISLQWRTDGTSGVFTNIPGATNSSFTTTPFRTGTFQYALVVTNNYGSATSAVASVTVQPLAGTVNVYANLSQVLSPMPAHGLGVCTATYDNNLINNSIAPKLAAAGISAVRYPGGSQADVFNWQTTTGNNGAFVNANDSFTNFMSTIVNPAGARAVITVNYGSNPANNGGGDTNVAAAWVAYANVTNHWNVKYWEIGNEIGGNGYYGTNQDWEYDLHYPETNAATRVGQPALSPAAYGTNSLQFISAMKAKDSTIKCGVGFDTGNSTYNSQLLGVCGSAVDFVIIHYYPDGSAAFLLTQPANIPGIIQNTRTQLTNNTGAPHAAQMEIAVTETGAGTNTGVVASLFAADNFLTWLENGAVNVDYQILHNDLLTSSQQPGHAYYGAMMAHLLANIGDNFINATSDRDTLRVHATARADGKVGVMLLNTDPAQTNSVTVNIAGTNLASNGIAYRFGLTNFIGGSDTPSFPISTNSISGLGNQFTVSVPPYTMIDLLIPVQTNTPPVLAAISNRIVNVGQTVAFTASATDTDSPPQTLTFALLAGVTNATLNTNSGAFSFRPLVTQGDSTNPFTLKVSDSGSPSLSATQSFSVIVNPITLPTFVSVAMINGQFSFSISGQTGPDYEIQTSTNLIQWSVAFITNSPTLPFIWTDAGTSNSPVRFYRAVLGPPLP